MPHRTKSTVLQVRCSPEQRKAFLQWAKQCAHVKPAKACRFCLEFTMEYTTQHCPEGCDKLIADFQQNGHPVLRPFTIERQTKFHQEAGKYGMIWPNKDP